MFPAALCVYDGLDTRRRFSAQYKLRIVHEAERGAPGELGALRWLSQSHWPRLPPGKVVFGLCPATRQPLTAAGNGNFEKAVGALLRREGLYASHLTSWRKQRETGALVALAGK